ncbi:heavy-metal-associated domain-containing protein [Natrononativus amylolyticus]|uniref:heavy-metal-associated domain-containing protein n=1 Tax=Natrononativus amylolyticus TaxID=2963434 RepID=UPI0020CE36E4|nr:heavy-metal-associated domain-containing protein [Natrononativus amylolyticus]
MEQTTLEVRGMACDGCEQNVTETLEALEGVSSATASHADDQVRIEHDGAVVDVTALGGAIKDAGYEVA